MKENGSSPIVQVKDVVKRFPLGRGEITILKGISFDVAGGEFVSIVGPSGNGKSTLLNMITGIDRPSQGEVMVAGSRVNQMNEDALAHWRGETIGIIFQFFQMLPGLTLLNNVILPMELAGKFRPRERRERAMHRRYRRRFDSAPHHKLFHHAHLIGTRQASSRRRRL